MRLEQTVYLQSWKKKTGNYLKSSKGNQRGAFTFKDANSYSSHSPVSAPVEFTDDVAKKHFFTEKQDFTRDTVKEKYAIKQGSGLRITPVGSMNAVELTLSIDNKSTEESCFGSPNSRVSQLSNSSVIDTPSNQLDDKKDQIEKRTDTRQTCQSSRAFLIATQGSGLSLVSSTSSAFRRVNSKNSYLFEDTMAKNLVSEDITSLPSDQDLPSSMHGYEDHCSLKVPKMENFYPNKDSQEHVSSFTKLMSKMRWSKKGLGIKADVSMSSSKSSGASINHFKKRSLDTDYIIRNNASNPFSSTDETEVISNNAHASNRRRKTEGGDIIQNFI
uniref:Uncharacterized protein n=1 Tax=Corethron hystrix TaxID=216773 RepID=A0A7S1FXG0_9STRA|mmetsp:Transcript_39714/g.93023  ORF Transcript_39714/g.93023 Transcript_39714/m.93023 type:complete len:330 (+) Transcript_39714:199-1188(+)